MRDKRWFFPPNTWEKIEINLVIWNKSHKITSGLKQNIPIFPIKILELSVRDMTRELQQNFWFSHYTRNKFACAYITVSSAKSSLNLKLIWRNTRSQLKEEKFHSRLKGHFNLLCYIKSWELKKHILLLTIDFFYKLPFSLMTRSHNRIILFAPFFYKITKSCQR